MKLTGENADDFELVRKKVRNRKTGAGYYLQEECENCSDPFISVKKNGRFCCEECSKGLYIKGDSKSVDDYLSSIDKKLLSDYEKHSKPIKVQCKLCNHIYYPTVTNLKRGQTRCPNCQTNCTKVYGEDVLSLFNSLGLEVLSSKNEYKTANISLIKFKCDKCGKINEKTYSELKYHYTDNKDCKICKNLEKINPIKFTDIKKGFEDEGGIVHTEEYEYIRQNLTPIDCTCPNGHRQLKNVRKWRKGRRCPHCNTSGPELNIRKFIEKLETKVDFNNRKILQGRELDFYFPDLNKAIEFNGDYGHCNYNFFSEGHFNKHKELYAKDIGIKDRKKKLECKKKGVDLLVIGENDGRNNRNQVENKIRNFLSL